VASFSVREKGDLPFYICLFILAVGNFSDLVNDHGLGCDFYYLVFVWPFFLLKSFSLVDTADAQLMLSAPTTAVCSFLLFPLLALGRSKHSADNRLCLSVPPTQVFPAHYGRGEFLFTFSSSWFFSFSSFLCREPNGFHVFVFEANPQNWIATPTAYPTHFLLFPLPPFVNSNRVPPSVPFVWLFLFFFLVLRKPPNLFNPVLGSWNL